MIGNAIKYSKPEIPSIIVITGGKVTGAETGLALSVEEQVKTYYQVTVKDNGIGLKKTYANQIFNVFTRLHGLVEYEGTGVGLSIVRKVIENYNG